MIILRTIISPFFTHLTHKSFSKWFFSHSWAYWSFLCENSLNVNNNNRVWKTSSSSKAVSSIFSSMRVAFELLSGFELYNFKIHSTIMWSLQEGPRERVTSLAAISHETVECWSFSFAPSPLACNTHAWGRAKLCLIVYPFRSSNHGRLPIVIYQSFCLWCVLSLNQNPKKKTK